MGLKDAKAALIERAAKWYAADWYRRAAAGEKGSDMKEATLWLQANKTQVGVILNALSGLLTYLLSQDLIHGTGPKIVAACLFYFGGIALGAGTMKSDGYYQPQLQQLQAVKRAEEAGQ